MKGISELEKSFSLSAAKLVGNEIAIVTNGLSVQRSGERARLSYPRYAEVRCGDDDSHTLKEYLFLFQNGGYNLMFSDYSLLQVEIFFDRGQITEYRYVFYPCPFRSDDLAIFNMDPVELAIVLDSGSLQDYLRLRTPLRFEYAPQDAHPYHPASHVHLIDPHVRMGVGKVLSLKSFLRFVLETFYVGSWALVEQFWNHYAKDRDAPLNEIDIQRLYWTH